MENTPTPVASAPVSESATLTQPVAQSNIALAVIGAAVAALIGAAIWAAITVATEYQIGYMAIGIGFLVGFAVRWLGKGATPPFGVIGGAFSLLGCAAGNLFAVVGYLSKEGGVSFFSTLANLNLEVTIELMKATFSPMDVLFYGLAAYFGFKFSISCRPAA